MMKTLQFRPHFIHELTASKASIKFDNFIFILKNWLSYDCL